MSRNAPNNPTQPAPSQEEINAFCSAANNGDNTAIMVYLDKYGSAFVDARNKMGWTALWEAATSGEVKTVELLLGKGAAINGRDKDGWTALMGAAMSGEVGSISLLLEKGASLDEVDEQNKTALMWARENGNENAVTLLQQWPEIFRQRQEMQKQQEQRERDQTATTTAENRQEKLKQLSRRSSTLKKKPPF